MTSTPVKIGFDVTGTVKRERRGIANFIQQFLRALPRAAPEIEPILFIRDGRWFKRRWIADLLPDAERRWLLQPGSGRTGDLHRFHGLGTRLPTRARVPRSFILQDLRGLDAVEHSHAEWAPRRAERIRETVGRSDAIVFPTNFTRQRFRHYFPDFPFENTEVIFHGVDLERFRLADVETAERVTKQHDLDRPFLLQVSGLAPHKNPQASLEAFAQSHAVHAGLLLAFSGSAREEERMALEQRASQLGIRDAVRWLGSVAEADLPGLYSASILVLIPSLYEGFGLPALEAMACGAAGIAARGTSLEEVVGEAWLCADPHEPASFAQAIDRCLMEAGLLDRLREAGLAHARQYDWQRCARKSAAFLTRDIF